MSYDSIILADSPTVYWPLNETTGTTITDATGNGNGGTYVGSPTLNQTGIGDGSGAVLFASASSQYAKGTTVLQSTTNNWSVECWVKLNASSSGNTDGMFVHNGNNGPGGGAGWGVGLHGGTGLEYYLAHVDAVAMSYTFADFLWHHVVLVRNAGTAAAWVDNVQTGNTTTEAPGAPGNFAGLTVAAEAQLATGYARFVDATIAKAAIYPVALSTTQISNHFNGITGGPDPAVLRTLSSPRLV